MPQLVKGGKYVFGWSRIRDNGHLEIPPEAVQEYELRPGTDVILISASKTSGGFIIAAKSKLAQSPLGGILSQNPELSNFHTKEGGPIKYKKRHYGWTKIQDTNTIKLNKQTMEAYVVKPGDALLSARGSHIGIAMIVKGPIVAEARKHPEIKSF